jgi:hypothetical protein
MPFSESISRLHMKTLQMSLDGSVLGSAD